jgi:hypothetical protein
LVPESSLHRLAHALGCETNAGAQIRAGADNQNVNRVMSGLRLFRDRAFWSRSFVCRGANAPRGKGDPSIAALTIRRKLGDAALRAVGPPATPIGAVETGLRLAHGRALMVRHRPTIRGRTCFNGGKQRGLDAAGLAGIARPDLTGHRILR